VLCSDLFDDLVVEIPLQKALQSCHVGRGITASDIDQATALREIRRGVLRIGFLKHRVVGGSQEGEGRA
jgi:hypothetical protein